MLISLKMNCKCLGTARNAMEKRMAVPVVKATEEVPAAAMQDVAMIEDAGRMEAAMARR